MITRTTLFVCASQIFNMGNPIMPVMLYNPTKIEAFSREYLIFDLAIVVIGFPAVSIIASRARFCISVVILGKTSIGL